MKQGVMPERIMGLDVGETRIGVALSDPLGLTAQGIEVIKRVSPEKDMNAVKELISRHDVSKIVVGLPRNMDGSIGESARKVLEFASKIRECTGLEVVTVDERLTTKQAERILIAADMSRKRRKRVVDKTAASLILQAFLEQDRSR